MLPDSLSVEIRFPSNLRKSYLTIANGVGILQGLKWAEEIVDGPYDELCSLRSQQVFGPWGQESFQRIGDQIGVVMVEAFGAWASIAVRTDLEAFNVIHETAGGQAFF